MKRHFSKEYIQTTEKYMKRCTLLIIWEMQIKTMKWYNFTLVRMVTIINGKISSVVINVEKLEPLCPVDKNVNCTVIMGKSMEIAQRIKIKIIVWSSNSICGFISFKMEMILKRYSYTHVHWNIRNEYIQWATSMSTEINRKRKCRTYIQLNIIHS